MENGGLPLWLAFTLYSADDRKGFCSSFDYHFNSDALLQEKETMQQIQMLDETMKVHR